MGVGLSSSASAHHGPSIIVGLDGVGSGYDSRGGSSVRGGGGGRGCSSLAVMDTGIFPPGGPLSGRQYS